MKNISWANYISLLTSLCAAAVGVSALFDFRKLLFSKMPDGFTAAGYHDWLRTHTSVEDLRTLAIDGDTAITGMSDVIFWVAGFLIFFGTLNAICAGFNLIKQVGGSRG